MFVHQNIFSDLRIPILIRFASYLYPFFNLHLNFVYFQRLDDRGNMVVNCDGVLIQNNAFWPLTSDLSNILSHKVVADALIEDKKFLSLWTDVLKIMQVGPCNTSIDPLKSVQSCIGFPFLVHELLFHEGRESY